MDEALYHFFEEKAPGEILKLICVLLPPTCTLEKVGKLQTQIFDMLSDEWEITK